MQSFTRFVDACASCVPSFHSTASRLLRNALRSSSRPNNDVRVKKKKANSMGDQPSSVVFGGMRFLLRGEGGSSLVVAVLRVDGSEESSALADLLAPWHVPSYPFVLRVSKRGGGDDHRPCPEVAAALGAAAVAAAPNALGERAEGALRAAFPASLCDAPSPLMASVLPDLSALWFRREITVEIKPKGGVMPRFGRAEIETYDGAICTRGIHPLKAAHCRFSLMQWWKREKALAAAAAAAPSNSVSRYCPVDFFGGHSGSGDAPDIEVRRRRALEALLDSPQNNLRCFASSQDCTHQGAWEHQQMSVAALLLQRIDRSRLVDCLLQALSASPVCGRLLELQSRSSVDIELLHWLVEFSQRPKEMNGGGVKRVRFEGAFLARCSCHNDQHPQVRGVDELVVEGSHFDAWLQDEINNYYVAATAKDCSIMVSFGSSGEPGSASTGSEAGTASECPQTPLSCWVENERHLSRLSLADGLQAHVCCVDIDSKRHKSLRHYNDHDAEIVAAARRALNSTVSSSRQL